MSTLIDLEDYLLGKDRAVGYLLKDENNGKTVMLSGAWGSGKTHFWQNEIERVQQVIEVDGKKENKYTEEQYEEGLSFKLNEKKKSCVYISLYGKDSLSELKKEVLFRASAENDYLSDDIEAFGFNALSTIDEVGGAIAAVYKVATNMNESRRDKKGTNKLKDGGLICFDDFERKSKKIDLNDLFGFISQLAISLKCKVVIILNSDVFEGEEANVFKRVKEKTVSKYLFFNPEVEELFYIIFKDYPSLDKYEEILKKTFEEVNIINARIYKQVLDNIHEWIISNKSLIGDGGILRYFVLVNINFILTHYMVKADLVKRANNPKDLFPNAITGESNHKVEYRTLTSVRVVDNGLEYEKIDEYIRKQSNEYNKNFIGNLKQTIKTKEKSNTTTSGKYDNSEGLIEFINNNLSFIESLHFVYAFKVNIYGESHNQAEVDILNNVNNVNNFIVTGII